MLAIVCFNFNLPITTCIYMWRYYLICTKHSKKMMVYYCIVYDTFCDVPTNSNIKTGKTWFEWRFAHFVLCHTWKKGTCYGVERNWQSSSCGKIVNIIVNEKTSDIVSMYLQYIRNNCNVCKRNTWREVIICDYATFCWHYGCKGGCVMVIIW